MIYNHYIYLTFGLTTTNTSQENKDNGLFAPNDDYDDSGSTENDSKFIPSVILTFEFKYLKALSRIPGHLQI
ncbi:unnamed protein product [Rhizophagus irregularis]|nr:unnamed protein product [Rhizophagus irregularis]CAB5362241.1 unnamed protein product [Rhizophagus irregularis]